MTMDTASQRLRAKLDVAVPVFATAAQRLWTSPRVREIYPVYLATMHMIARATVPLLQAALDRATARAKHDELAAAFADFLPPHIERTMGRDTRMLDDLAATGADPNIPLQAIPSPRVASLVGAHYYWVHHHHPIALVGYLATIEGYPPPPGLTALLQARTRFPEQAYRSFLRLERTDPRRRAELHTWIDTLPLTRRHETLLGVSALHTVNAGVEVLREIHDRVILRSG
jgi:hypothetical protein